MAVTVDLSDPIELRRAGISALNAALGYSGARAFIDQYLGGIGDYTAEKYDQPDQSFDELTAELFEAETRMRGQAVR
jgi:hypothetical protein